jgi:hypothetical protein
METAKHGYRECRKEQAKNYARGSKLRDAAKIQNDQRSGRAHDRYEQIKERANEREQRLTLRPASRRSRRWPRS